MQVAAYEFTTLTCIPGVVRYNGAKIQLLDLPGIIEGAKDGKGRGRQVLPCWSHLQLCPTPRPADGIVPCTVPVCRNVQALMPAPAIASGPDWAASTGPRRRPVGLFFRTSPGYMPSPIKQSWLAARALDLSCPCQSSETVPVLG